MALTRDLRPNDDHGHDRDRNHNDDHNDDDMRLLVDPSCLLLPDGEAEAAPMSDELDALQKRVEALEAIAGLKINE